MSRGKYSPICPHASDDDYEYKYNCFGQLPEPWKGGDEYNAQTMFDDYDDEGYDSYGYSCFIGETYVGAGKGADRDGYTEMDYLTLQDLPSYERETYYDCD